MTMPATLDLAEFRLLRALREQGGEGPFTQLWNAQAGHLWSVLRGVFGRDEEALGWMASFRVDLAQRAASFRLEEPLAPQVGAALYAHVCEALPEGGMLPWGPLPPTPASLAELPQRTRLGYLVDLFFDWTPPDPSVRVAYGLLEPAADTNARLVVYAACLRSPPVAALIFPPGLPPGPARSPGRGRLLLVFGLLVAMIATFLALWWQVPVPSAD